MGLKLALYSLALVAVLGMLAACQYSGVVECNNTCTVNVHDTTQDRGRQQTDAVNPRVDNTGDISAIPGL